MGRKKKSLEIDWKEPEEKTGEDQGEEQETEQAEGKKLALIFDDKGKPKNIISNYTRILENNTTLGGKVPYLGGILSYNILAHSIYLRKAPPWFIETKEELPEKGRQITDTDIDHILKYIEDYFQLSGEKKIISAINITASKARYHPVIEMLETLPYEGDGYIKNLLPDYLGTDPESEYNAEVMRLAMLAGVARVFEPGTKYDHMPILQGAQGLGKTEFLKHLAIDRDYYTDTAPKFKSAKDDGELLAGKWIVEFGELASMKNSEVESVKQFITATADRYRPAYGHGIAQDFPRQVIFFGSTNSQTYLKDTTGNRRFLPIICGIRPPVKPIEKHPENLKSLDEDIRKAWAEAVHLYKTSKKEQGEVKLILPEAVHAEALKRQEAAREVDAWQPLIEKILYEQVEKKRTPGGAFQDVVTVNIMPIDIYLKIAESANAKEMNQTISRRINKIIETLPEWEYKTTVRTENGQGRGYRFQHTAEETEAYINKYKKLPSAEELNNEEDADGEDIAAAAQTGIVNIDSHRKRRTSSKTTCKG